MKFKGKSFSGPRVHFVVIPRDGEDLVFKAQAVLDYSPFEKMFPRPEPPMIRRPRQAPVPDLEDKEYVDSLDEWSSKRIHWMILQSLKATEDLEWETVDYSNPETWGNYEKELTDAGFSPVEVASLINAVLDACGLNQTKIDDATTRFLALRDQSPEE